MTIEWRAAVELAGHAPSIHNTQPWRFIVHDDRVELWADRSRAVPAIDPSGRQLAVSCGAALEYLCLALAAGGHSFQVVPEISPRSDLLATLRVTGAAGPDLAAAELVAAMPKRATVRAPFDARPIPPEVIESLGAEVRTSGAWLRPVADHDSLITLTVLLQHANEAQLADPGYVSEIGLWRHSESALDGIPDTAAPGLQGRHSNVALRDFNPGGDGPPPATDLPVDEHPAVAIVGTNGDGVADWLAAGRGTARLLLRAATQGIAASPLNQVIDDAAPRQKLRAQLRLVGFPQMVLRLGYAEMSPTTHRRPVEDYATIIAD